MPNDERATRRAPSKGAAALPESHALRLRSLATDVLRDLAWLTAYQRQLEWARATATPGRRTRLRDRGLVAAAREARERAARVAGRILDILVIMRNTGFLDDAHEAWRAHLEATGPARASERWTPVLRDEQVRALLYDHGFDKQALEDLEAGLAAQDQVHSAVEGGLRIAPEGAEVAFDVPSPAASERVTGAADLLLRDVVDDVAEAFNGRRRPPVSVKVTPREGRHAVETLHLLEGATATLLRMVRGMERHARKLEVEGLAAYRGGDPATTAIIVGIVLVGAAVAVAGHCYTDIIENNDEICYVAVPVVTFLGVLLVGTGNKANEEERLRREYEEGMRQFFEELLKPPPEKKPDPIWT